MRLFIATVIAVLFFESYADPLPRMHLPAVPYVIALGFASQRMCARIAATGKIGRRIIALESCAVP